MLWLYCPVSSVARAGQQSGLGAIARVNLVPRSPTSLRVRGIHRRSVSGLVVGGDQDDVGTLRGRPLPRAERVPPSLSALAETTPTTVIRLRQDRHDQRSGHLS